ncbi:MAG TPA: hypothetical protein VF614_01270 [Chthoniobacteraceae bacterium]|jgi:hypothetical protein
MQSHSLLSTTFSALVLATCLSAAQDIPPQAAQLEAAGFKVHKRNPSGYAVDFGKVKVLDDASIANIAALREVRELSGTGEGVDNAVLAKLVKAAPDLETFFVNGSTITDEGLTVLSKLPKLRHLGVHHGPKEMKGKGLLALKGNQNFKSVEFGGMQSIDDESVGYLAEMPHLRAINIYHTMNTRASLPLLVKKNPLLEKFSLNPHFDPKRFSAEDIAMLAPLKNLSELLLNDMVLPYENGLSHLTALKGLKKVSLEWSIYKDEDLAKLKAALPGVEIISTNRAKPEELAKWNERVEAMKKEATKAP